MPETPLDLAVEAHERTLAGATKVERLSFVKPLMETGLFSCLSVGRILDLDYHEVTKLTGKSDKTGGRLNPAALTLIRDIWAEYNQDARSRNVAAMSQVLQLGVTSTYLARLTGVPKTNIDRWVAAYRTENQHGGEDSTEVAGSDHG